MALTLKTGVHWCVANHRVVLLDLTADRYIALPHPTDAQFQALANEPLRGNDLPALTPLISSGLLLDRPNIHLQPPPQLPPPTQSLIGSCSQGCRPSLEAWLIQFLMKNALKTVPLSQIIAQTRARKAHSLQTRQAVPSAQIERAISAYLSSRRLISAQEQCLRWSLAMVAFLARRGYYPQLVIGVRMMPFGAHAWVQEGDIVLSDTVPNVAPYTPILVV